MKRHSTWLLVLLALAALPAGSFAAGSFAAGSFAAGAAAVRESPRQIPVAYDVDVVVVGGGTGAVSAAVAAAGAGARVFLAAPYPYLGDDMTATLRLWLNEGETPKSPLAKAIFNDPVAAQIEPQRKRLALSYTATRPSGAPHPDTDPPSRLADGAWGDASKESVQYDGDVTLDADLGKPRRSTRSASPLTAATRRRWEAAASTSRAWPCRSATTSNPGSRWRS